MLKFGYNNFFQPVKHIDLKNGYPCQSERADLSRAHFLDQLVELRLAPTQIFEVAERELSQIALIPKDL